MNDTPKFRGLQDEIRFTLLQKRILFLGFEVDDVAVVDFTSDLLYVTARDFRPVRVIMSSPGGDVYAGIAIYNAIRDSVCTGIVVNVEVRGLCASIAAVILQAASKRIACRGTRFLLHEVSEFKIFSEESATEKFEQADELSKCNRTLAAIIAERCGKPVAEILKKIKKRDWWLSAEEALEYNLIDEIF